MSHISFVKSHNQTTFMDIAELPVAFILNSDWSFYLCSNHMLLLATMGLVSWYGMCMTQSFEKKRDKSQS